MFKNQNCGKKSKFYSKIEIFVKNLNFVQKSEFYSKIKFGQKLKFCSIIEILVEVCSVGLLVCIFPYMFCIRKIKETFKKVIIMVFWRFRFIGLNLCGHVTPFCRQNRQNRYFKKKFWKSGPSWSKENMNTYKTGSVSFDTNFNPKRPMPDCETKWDNGNRYSKQTRFVECNERIKIATLQDFCWEIIE